jgi:phosphoribosylformylglycinamidine synthase I
MKVGIVVFPGSNCDHDAWFAVSQNLQQQAEFIWHEAASVGQVDAVILPGGFAFGDYLRCGAIAKFSPVMRAVKNFAQDGGLVLGICNGFQVLTEAGLLPGALVRNANRQFVCRTVPLEIISTNSPFTHKASNGQILNLPVAHGEGCYVADQSTLDQLQAEDRVVIRYLQNPNGSMRDIAGIVNAERNVMGIMPHPERASDALLGNTDGTVILRSMLAAVAAKTPALALSGS